MGRYTILDGFRGFFLIFMGVVHFNEQLNVTLGKLNHHYFGWVEDAQGFVFISGFVVGLVYGSIYLKRSAADMQRAVFSRMRTIYSHQAGLILIFLGLALFFQQYGQVPAILQSYAAEPVYFTLASLGLVSASTHMGILPMYIWFMLITPFVLRGLHRGWAPGLCILCLTVWVFAQSGLVDLLTARAETIALGLGHEINFGIFFNVFGWQMLFFVGLFGGFGLAQGTLDLSPLRHPSYTVAFFFGLMAFFFLGCLDRAVFDYWFSPAFTEGFLASISRQDFSSLYVLAFFLDLFLIVWLIYAGPFSARRWVFPSGSGVPASAAAL